MSARKRLFQGDRRRIGPIGDVVVDLIVAIRGEDATIDGARADAVAGYDGIADSHGRVVSWSL